MATVQTMTQWAVRERSEPPPFVVVGHNGADGSRSSSPNAAAMFEPVRSGLLQVENKLRTLDSSLFSPLANAFINLIGSGGKRLRPALALLSAEFNGALAAQSYASRVISLAASVEMLHTSTLVHDDVIDGALLRRGAPTLNASWTGGATVLAGNYMFGAAAQLAAETEHMRVIRIFSQTLKVIVDGELQQLLARFDYNQPKENYYHRIYAKTASLFCAATEGAAILSGLPEARVQDLHDYGYNLGMAFQIVDDILDFTGDETTLGKPAGSDLHQGTLTLPFFYYRRSHPEPTRLIERLEDARLHAENGNPGLWRRAVDALVHDLRSSHAIQSARDEAEHFLNRARASLAALPDNIYKRTLLNLCDFVVQRKY